MTTGTGAPVEGADVVSGSGTASTSGSAAITESHDAVSGVGSTPGGGAGAAAEAHDAVSGVGIAIPPGSGAVAESSDVVVGAGSGSAIGAATIVEAVDAPSSAGGVAYSGWGTGPPVFAFPPDWSQDWSPPMTEILNWRTDVMRADVTGTSYHNSQRIAPGRAFEFYAVDAGSTWRIVDQVIDALGGGYILLPIWPDAQVLTAAVNTGDVSIPCETDGRDFTAPGFVLLWTSPMEWVVVELASIGSEVLNLQGACPYTVAPGARLYPLRNARLADGGQEYVWGGADKGYRTLHFDIYETCDWPAATLTTTYQTHPVLEWRPNEDMTDQPITAGYGRMLGTVDNSLGDPEVMDLAGISLRGTAMEFYIQGRTAHTNFRGLLYALRGAASPIWVPTFKQDFLLVGAALSTDTTLTVEWSAYTVLQALYPNRKDIRIELMNGTVLYRRITAAAVSGANEVLTVDSAVGVAIQPSAVRSISFMRLSTIPDSIQIQHLTDGDGLAICTMTLSAVTPDV